jgi:hypothetical protein
MLQKLLVNSRECLMRWNICNQSKSVQDIISQPMEQNALKNNLLLTMFFTDLLHSAIKICKMHVNINAIFSCIIYFLAL